MTSNKKIVSLAVVFAMLMTMLSSFVVANAAETPEVYTKIVSSDDTSAKLEIGFKNFAEEYTTKAVGNVTVKVKIPEGFKADSIALDEKFKGATENVKGDDATANTDGEIIIMKVDSTGDGYTIGTSGVIATVDCSLKAAPAETTDYAFDIKEFKCTDLDMNSITLAKGNVTAKNAVHTVEVEQVVTGPAVYVSDAVVKDGKVELKIGYKQFAEEYATKAVGNVTVKVKIPEGFTADSIALDEKFKGATENVKGDDATANTDGEIIIMKVDSTGDGYTIGTEGVIATVTMTAPADFDGKVKAEITEFKCTDLDMNSITLAKGNVTAIAGKITVGGGEVTPSPTPTQGPTGDVKIALDKTTATAAAGKTVKIKATVTGSDNKAVTAEATGGAEVKVNDDVVSVTIPEKAQTGDKITVTVTAKADKAVTATCVITVDNPVYEVEGKVEDLKVNGVNVKMFKPKFEIGDADKFKAKFVDKQKYRIVFDFTTASDANTGWAMQTVTGEQLKAVADGVDLDISASASGAANASLHIEDMDGNVIDNYNEG